ncbi:MAG: biotin--[Clostridia bacterium]|nr:biotin--[acetyl-CoA-carboxylase] ligase [Clostridia bacterium]
MSELNINIFHYKSLESTNKTALEISEWKHLDTVVADNQSRGKGRFGRTFYSECGLYMSVILDPQRIQSKIQNCTPAAALAVVEALSEAGIDGLKIKWVNDIFSDGKKICGILTEAQSVSRHIDKIVVGIGININVPQESFPDEIKNKAGSIVFDGDKLELAKAIAKNLDKYTSLSKEEIAKKYNENLAFVGSEITVHNYANNFEKVTGKIIGVDENCYLMLGTKDGDILHIYSGEICDK